MAGNPPLLPSVQHWPLLDPPDCPTCQQSNAVVWIGPATTADGTEVNVWNCEDCDGEFTVPVTRWPVLDGPDCPTCDSTDTCWAALDPDNAGDLWTCEHGHGFTLTPEGLIILPEDV